MKTIILFTLFISASVTWAHDHGGGGAAIGKGKGVESYDEHDGFVLAKAAIKRLKIGVSAPLATAKECSPKAAQGVAALDKKMIYIQRGEFFKGLRDGCASVKAGDRLVTVGAEFLRVIEMDLTGGEEDEHAEEAEGAHEDHDAHQKEEHHD